VSEQTASSVGIAVAPALPGRLLAPGSSASVLIAAAAIALAAILGYLYFKTQGTDFKRQNEVLTLLRDLKAIDARWDVDILRTRTEFTAQPAPAVDYSGQIARVRQQLTAASQEINSPVLKRGLNELSNAFTQKAELVDKFRKANAATKQALSQILAADAEIAGLVRASWPDIRDRERLVAVEAAVAHLIADAQKYYFGGEEAQRKSIETFASELKESGAQLPTPVREGLARLDGNVQQLLGAKPVEEDLFLKLSFITSGPRVDSLTNAFSREVETLLTDREFYRIYLIAFSGALLVLVGYLVSRLMSSYRRLDLANEDLERRVVERTRELSEALHQLKESEVQLIQTEKMSSLGQMVAGVAHEINTPLAYVKNSLGTVKGKLPELMQVIDESEKLMALLKGGGADPNALAQQFALVQSRIADLEEHEVVTELQALVKDGLYGIEQISEIVINLKNFSRLDRSKVSSYNLNEGLESTMLLAKHELKRHTIQRHYGDIPPITCSASQINQVLLNLLTNAAQAIESEQGTITLTTRREDDAHVAVEIEDNGKGIPPDVLPKIFDPFFTTKDVGKGTGLGLSIVYRIVKEHGGRITVDSAVGIGTKFKLVLPLIPPTDSDAAASPVMNTAPAF
jgi:two-component system, NtrC family, sensor kinase